MGKLLHLIATAVLVWALPLPATAADTEPCQPVKKPQWTVKFNELEPHASKFFRSFTFVAERIDQPDFVGADLINDPMENPEDDLFKLSLVIAPGSLFQFSDELAEVYKAAADHPKLVLFEDPLQGVSAEDRLKYFARVRGVDMSKRVLNSLSGSVGFSERAAFVSNAIVDDITLEEDESEFVWSATWNPDRLIRFAGEISSAYSALDSYSKLTHQTSGLSGSTSTEVCGPSMGHAPKSAVSCLEAVSDIEIGRRWVGAALPAITFKVVDQFDFIKNDENIFVPNPLLEENVDTLTVTWDLSKTLDTAKHRRAALAAIAKHDKLVARDRKLAKAFTVDNREIKVKKGGLIYVPLEAKFAAGDVKWSFKNASADPCAKPDHGLHLSKAGVLSGYASTDLKVSLVAEDGFRRPGENTAESTVEIKVIP